MNNNAQLNQVLAYMGFNSSISFYELISIFLIIIFILVIRKNIVDFVFRIVYYFLKKTLDTNDTIVLKNILRIKNFLSGLLFGFIISVPAMNKFFPKNISAFFWSLSGTIITFSIFYLFNIVINIYSNYYNKAHTTEESRLNPVLNEFVKYGIKSLLFVSMVFMISEKWGFNLTGILATLGFFSLAVSLAAKDTVANIFGGISVIFDKPYLIGDTISIGDIQGCVEIITFRYTVVRNHNQSLIYIPNQLTAMVKVANHSKKEKRPLILNIQIPKTISFTKTDELLTILKDDIMKTENVISEFVITNLDSITSTTINISLVCHLTSIDHEDYTKTKGNIIKSIAQNIENNCSIELDKINIE